MWPGKYLLGCGCQFKWILLRAFLGYRSQSFPKRGNKENNTVERIFLGILLIEKKGRSDCDGNRRTYPRIVRQMLISRSAPQPAMKKTPKGGTVQYSISKVAHQTGDGGAY